MNTSLGIDFGTTNSTLCYFDGADYRYVDLEDGRNTIPSLMYVDRQYYPTYGEAARTRFLEDNQRRQIKLEKTDLGYIQITLGDNFSLYYEHTGFDPVPTTIDAKISGFTDRELPGFLFASTKRLLGQNTVDSVKLFEKNIKLEAVVSSIIQHMRKRSSNQYAGSVTHGICVGRPVNYECAGVDGQDACNDLAVERMRNALAYAEIAKYDFFLEPIAPVIAYLHESEEEPNQVILVLDFGGGTVDFSLLRKRGSKLQVVANDGRPLGGDMITERLIRDFVFPRMGLTDANLNELRSRHNYLGEMIPDILNWRTTYQLNQPKYFMQIAEATRLLPHEATKLNRIRLLIVQNFSYNVFLAVETAKKRLSDTTEVEIALDPIDIRFSLTRDDLERSIDGYLDTIETTVLSFCAENGFESGRIGRVLLTGGTSLIPCIRRRIDQLFPRTVVPVDPFLSVVKGFALGAWLQGERMISLEENQMEIDTELL